MLEKFIKSYSGTYKYTTMVRHKGIVIAFAMDENRHIWYTILDLGGSDPPDDTNQESKSPLDVNSWQADLTELIFPNEIAEIGFGVADRTLLPVFKKNSTQPEIAGAILPPGKENEFDYFRSTTARFIADAPFQVLSDGRYIYVFRQAINKDDQDDMVYIDEDGNVLVKKGNEKGCVKFNNTESKNEWVVSSDNNPIPLVNKTLLVDRFLLTGTRLTPKMEVRYQRSRSKTRPASRKDSLGPKDLDGNFFYEPTQELRFISNLTGGRFSVLLLPTAIAEIQRWQIFAENSETGRMDSYNVERSEDGLFSTRGTQTYTCIDHSQVYAKRGGVCSECGKTLISRIVTKGYSESALKFNGDDQYINNFENNFAPLFSVDLTPVDELDKGIVPESLRQEFLQNKRPLLESASVEVDLPDTKWTIVDGIRMYQIIKENQSAKTLNVYNFENAITVETWIKPENSAQQPCIIAKDDKDGAHDYSLGINAEGKLSFAATVSGNLVKATSRFAMVDGTWYHIAGTFDGSAVRIFVNGKKEEGETKATGKLSTSVKNLSFARSSSATPSPFAGTIDEVRMWKRARSESELQADMHQRLTGLESDLVGYWRFDEGGGDMVHDQSNNQMDGTIKGADWVISDAPVGEHPGIERASFRIKGRTFTSPPTSLLYYQQSKAAGGYSGNEKYIKNAGRVMLAVATNDGSDENVDKNHIAALDFGISNSGRLAQLADIQPLSLINSGETITDQSINSELDAVTDLEAQIPAKRKAVDSADKRLTETKSIHKDLVEQIKDLVEQIKEEEVIFYRKSDMAKAFPLLRKRINNISQPVIVSVSELPTEILEATKETSHYIWNVPPSITVTEGSNKKQWRIEVRPDPTSQINEASRKIDVATSELNAAQKALADLVKEIQSRKSKLEDGSFVTMPRVQTDPLGLTVSGGVLGFAWTKDAPLLFDSATGRLALYFRGRDDQFFVAYYDTFTERARITLSSSGNDAVTCFSTSAAYDKVTMQIEDIEDEQADAFCTVKIKYGDAEGNAIISESWKKVPRDPIEFSKVLNGQATGHSYIGSGKVKNGELSLSAPGARRAIKIGTILMVGNERIEVREQVFSGGTLIPYKGNIKSTEVLPVFHVEYDYAVNASCEGVSADLSNGSILIRAVPAGNGGLEISNTADDGVDLETSLVCKWTAAAPGSTISFDGKTQLAEAREANQLEDFDAAGDLTLEAWVNPGRADGQACVVRHRSPDSTYMLALEGLQSALTFDGQNDTVKIPDAEQINFKPDQDFSIEAWIKISPKQVDVSFDSNHIISKWSTRGRPFVIRYLLSSSLLEVSRSDTENVPTLTSTRKLNDGVFHHVAIVKDNSRLSLYIDGILDSSTRDRTNSENGNDTSNNTPLYLASLEGNRNHFKGSIDEVRIWRRARTPEEIQADMNRRLTGSETDLVGYWHFENGKAKDYSIYQHDGEIRGEPSLITFMRSKVIAGVGEKLVQTRESIPAGNWTHLAATYHQAYGLKFDAGDSLDCGNDTTLDINQDLTIEVFFQYQVMNSPQNILQRGIFGDGDDSQHVPYSFSILPRGNSSSEQLVFSFEDIEGNRQEFSQIIPLDSGRFYKIAITRKRKTIEKEDTADNLDNPVSASADITFYVGDAKLGSFNQSVDVGNSNKPLIIGQTFVGFISEVRIWNRACTYESPDNHEINKDLTGSERGLVSWWRFQEGTGSKAFDSKSQNHATINGAQWVESPDPYGSPLKLLINGQPIKVDEIKGAEESKAWTSAVDQFTLGARKSDFGFDQHFQGELEEVRIWQTTRTEEQIQDNLFRRIPGEKEDLIAYYTFDAEVEKQISDYSLRGNHLTLVEGTNYVLSTAPVGDDTPQVRSALAGIHTPFSGKIGSAPSVQEYGDMQHDRQGNLIGVFKRCYSYIRAGEWQIITGYKVGDMVTEWIGQVQFAPQLIGFIEGAPPVPSENLTQPSIELIGDLDDYSEASIVEMVEAQETTYTYSSTKEGGFDMEWELGFKFGAKSETEAGAFLISSVEQSKFLVGPRARFESSWGWSEEASTGVNRTTSKNTSLELRGRYTMPEEITPAREPFGRRFVPDNVGLAVVQSETADVFALRLKHNGALIAFQMRPNPDIPKDWNIIHFPINPHYIKQGTLDGKIGPVTDVDYPNALTYSSDSSYFKPLEAYALKNRIQREEIALQTYYAQYAAQDRGRPDSMPSKSVQDITDFQTLAQKLHRNLINTYVWTTDGGLFADTQQTMEMQLETYSGSYDFKGMAGVDLTIAFAIMKVASQFELNAMFGGHQHLSVNKSKESKTAFQLNINLDKVERDIYKRDPDNRTIVLLDKSDPKRPKPIKYPGKVDAYRFMSFYLEPSSDHFDDFFNLVVDPIWLEQSDDPAAVALRGARDDNKEQKPAPWRVMHRVTYVSRILPPLDLSAPPSLEKTLQTLDIDSNYELIKHLDPYVRDHLTPFSDFTRAVDRALETYLPELKSHHKEIKQYLSLYYGIDEFMSAPQVEGIGEGQEIEPAPNRPPIVKAGLYPEALLQNGESITWTPDLKKTTVRDDRLEKIEDLFLTWEFIPDEKQKMEMVDVGFDDPHKLDATVTFREKGQYRLQLTASDGILSASDETVLIVNQVPVIESITAGDPERSFDNSGELIWTVDLSCKIRTGLGDPSKYDTDLTFVWSVESGSKDKIEFLDSVKDLSQDKDDPNLVMTSRITVTNSGYYLLKCTVDNGGLKGDSEINLEVAARVTEGLQALYTFKNGSGSMIPDVSGSAIPLDLTASETDAMAWVDSGLEIRDPAILSANASSLTKAAKTKNEITLEAWIEPALDNAPGLRRILTLSNGPAVRNFILAQSGGTFHAGLRTTNDSGTDENASLRSIAGGVVKSNKLVHLVFTRSKDSEAKLYIDGKIVSNRKISGDFSHWDEGFQLALGNELGSDGRTDMAWPGKYHLVAIYDRALSADEITQNLEFGPDRDLPPQVSVGNDMEVNWSIPAIIDGDAWLKDGVSIDDQNRLTLDLHGVVRHDRPTAGKVMWSQVSAPSGVVVVFEDNADPVTKASFPRSGKYKLRLTAEDGIGQKVSKETTIKITHETPAVEINIPDENLTVTLDEAQVSLKLSGAIKNTLGGDYPLGKLSLVWSCDSENVTFPVADPLEAKAKFIKNGIYRLTLTAVNLDDEEKTASASVQITVNRPPVVDAGPDQNLLLSVGDSSVTTQLDGTISDDGLPETPGVVNLKWSVEEGNEEAVTIVAADKDFTEVQFKQEGDYILKLEADDGAVKVFDTVKITVKNNGMLPDGGKKAKVLANHLNVRQDHDPDNAQNILYTLSMDNEVTVIDIWTNPETSAIWVRLEPTESHNQDPQWSAMKVGDNRYIEFME